MKVTTGKAFKMEGIPEMKKCLAEIRKTLSAEGNAALAAEIRQALLITADMIAREARDLAPVGATGRLRNAIKAIEGKGAAALAYVDSKEAPYARFVERGTSRMPAKPYFRPAVRCVRPLAARTIAQYVEPIISKAAAMNAWKAPVK